MLEESEFVSQTVLDVGFFIKNTLVNKCKLLMHSTKDEKKQIFSPCTEENIFELRSGIV